MDEQLQERLNEAAEQFATAVKGSYQAVTDSTVSAQQRNAELTQDFFNKVINNLRNEAARNRQVTQELAGQQQRQWEAAQALAQETTNTYLDFLNSMFFYYQGNTKEAERRTEESEIRVVEEPGRSAGGAFRDLIKETIRRSRGEI
ncbi:MAG: hypothetical protein JOZ19_08695 [Rubrobacter sp.]|nr:hypothetical protein [Rubrobacter sp.]